MAHSWPYPLATVLILLLLWDLTVRLFGLPVYLIPRPSAVASRIVSDAGLLLRHGGVTLAESVGGFLLSVAIGVPPGMARWHPASSSALSCRSSSCPSPFPRWPSRH